MLTLIPFGAALGVLLVIGGQVREKGRELSAKAAELQTTNAELLTVRSAIGSAQAEHTRVQSELNSKKAELAALQTKVTQAASLLTDPELGNAQQRVEQASEVLVKDTPLGRAQELWRQGYAAYLRKEMAEAEQKFLAAKAADPTYAPPYNSLGNLEYNKHNYAQALVWYRQAVALRPTYAPSHYNTALVEQKLGNTAAALAAANEALRVRKGYREASELKTKLEASRSPRQSLQNQQQFDMR